MVDHAAHDAQIADGDGRDFGVEHGGEYTPCGGGAL